MFEWDEAKRIANLDKRALDFADAVAVFDGRVRLGVPARHAAEDRVLSVGELEGIFVTLVWTWRGDKRRIISARRARREERQAYLSSRC